MGRSQIGGSSIKKEPWPMGHVTQPYIGVPYVVRIGPGGPTEKLVLLSLVIICELLVHILWPSAYENNALSTDLHVPKLI